MALVIVVVAAASIAGTLIADAQSMAVLHEDHVVAAARRWVRVDVTMSEPTLTTFSVRDDGGDEVFWWETTIDGTLPFVWRGRFTDGSAVPSGHYQLSIRGPDLIGAFPLKVNNRPGRRDAVPPGGPTGLRVTAAVDNTLTWVPDPAPDAVSYVVYRAPAADGPWMPVASVAPEGAVDAPPDLGVFWYRVSSVDLGGNESPPTAPVSSDLIDMAREVGPAGDTLLPSTGTIRLEIPAGAVSELTIFTIQQVDTVPGANVNRVMVTRAFEVGPDGTTFDAPALISLEYAIPAGYPLPAGYPADTTFIQFWDGDGWTAIAGATVDTAAQVVMAPLVHLSLFQGASVTDPHGGYADGTNLCGYCHQIHSAPGPNLHPLGTQRETCYQCHDGTGASTDIRGVFGETVIGASTKASFHPVPTATDGYQLVCGDCHTPHNLLADYPKLLRVSDGAGGYLYSSTASPVGNTYCYSCHGSGSVYPDPLGDHTSFQGGAHQLITSGPASGSEIQCINCHDPHGSDFRGLSQQEATCFGCHNSTTPNTSGGSDPEYAFSAAANDYTVVDGTPIRLYHHPIAASDQDGGTRVVECASCHNAHLADQSDSATTSKIIDPAATITKLPLEWDTASGGMNRETTGNLNAFCETCHVDPATISPVTMGTWVPYLVLLSDDSSVDDDDGKPHDGFDAAYYETDTKSDHGPPGGNLACTACHDFHGSSNAYMLREDIVNPSDGSTGTMTGYTAVLSDWQKLQGMCLTCHPGRGTNHGANKICTQCHYHGSGKF